MQIIEDFEEIRPVISDHDEEIWLLRDGIVNVAKALRLGYHAEIYKKAMRVELDFNKFSCDEHVRVPVYYQNVLLQNYEIDYWLINQKNLARHSGWRQKNTCLRCYAHAFVFEKG